MYRSIVGRQISHQTEAHHNVCDEEEAEGRIVIEGHLKFVGRRCIHGFRSTHRRYGTPGGGVGGRGEGQTSTNLTSTDLASKIVSLGKGNGGGEIEMEESTILFP